MQSHSTAGFVKINKSEGLTLVELTIN